MVRSRFLPLMFGIILFFGVRIAAGGDFGLGIIAGEPTGLSGKFWFSPKNAMDGGVAWSLQGEGSLHLHLDYLLHDFNLIRVEQGKLPLYYGIGGRILIHDDDAWWRDHHGNSDTHIGLRIPVGLEYIFRGDKVDLFLEIAPVLDLVPETDLDINGGIGVRYFF